jgi:hypothetical protein
MRRCTGAAAGSSTAGYPGRPPAPSWSCRAGRPGSRRRTSAPPRCSPALSGLPCPQRQVQSEGADLRLERARVQLPGLLRQPSAPSRHGHSFTLLRRVCGRLLARRPAPPLSSMTDTTARRCGHGEDAIYFDAAKNRYVGAISLTLVRTLRQPWPGNHRRPRDRSRRVRLGQRSAENSKTRADKPRRGNHAGLRRAAAARTSPRLRSVGG